MDFTASLARIAGARPAAGYAFDGIDLLKSLAERRPPAERTLFWRERRGTQTWRAVRHGALKYVSRTDGDRVEEHLFDLATDTGEARDLAGAKPKEMEALKGLLVTWEQEVAPRR
jgi:hypothetical protein